MNKAATLILSLALAYSAAFVGSFFTFSAIETWYAFLTKPALNPPNWIFGPVWTLLYTLMAVAAWRVYEKHTPLTKATRNALLIYGAHLAINALWSIMFFGLQAPGASLGIIAALLASIIAIAVLFYRIDRVAGLLFIPYIVWVSFATYLNFSIVVLN